MNEVQPNAAATAAAAAVSNWSVAYGVGFIVAWFVVAAGWSFMTMLGAVMSNDSGRLTPERHVRLMAIMVAGLALSALAGVAGGFAFFRPDIRTILLWVFAGAFLVGVALQLYSFLTLTSSTS